MSLRDEMREALENAWYQHFRVKFHGELSESITEAVMAVFDKHKPCLPWRPPSEEPTSDRLDEQVFLRFVDGCDYVARACSLKNMTQLRGWLYTTDIPGPKGET